jgi:hypothetical protein
MTAKAQSRTRRSSSETARRISSSKRNLRNAEIECLAYETLRLAREVHAATEPRERTNETARRVKERWIKSRADLALFGAHPLILIGIIFPSAPIPKCQLVFCSVLQRWE